MQIKNIHIEDGDMVYTLECSCGNRIETINRYTKCKCGKSADVMLCENKSSFFSIDESLDVV